MIGTRSSEGTWNARRVPVLAIVASCLLASCAGTVKVVKLDSAAVMGTQRVWINPCNFRLKEVRDERVDGKSGGLNWNQLVIEDAVSLIRVEALKAGLLPADSTGGRDVVIALRHIYVANNNISKVPVVVYSVTADGRAPFIIRAQPSRMNWNGSENETRSSVSMALHQANDQLMLSLNNACDRPV
jgi:hypothetical protein